MELVGDVEALKKDGGVGLGLVAVLIANDALKFAQPRPILIGHLRLVVDNFALFQCSPKCLIPHNDRIDNAIGVKLVLVLLEDAELTRANDGALLGVDLASEHVHERGLTGAVGAGEAVAAASGERHRDVFKEQLGAVAHCDIRDRNHQYYFLMASVKGT